MLLSTPQKQITAITVVVIAVGVLYLGVKWQSSTVKSGNLTPLEIVSGNAGATSEGVLSNEPATRVQFLSSLFSVTKPPPYIARVILQDPDKAATDSLQIALKWAEETRNAPLVALLHADLMEFKKQGTLTDVAREFVFLAASQIENETQRAFLFQQGKKWIDIGLQQDRSQMPLRNALIVYQSEYLNQPMAFVGTLKESQEIDSNDLELNFIHLNLLKKSNQMGKAVKKCEKLVSLQPENPYWLFELSDLYGQSGDSVNAKTYLNLAVKLQRKQTVTQ